MSFLRRLFRSPAAQEITGEVEWLTIRDWSYPVASDIGQLISAVAQTETGALRIETRHLGSIEKRAHQAFARRFGERSAVTRTFWSESPLICAGCQRQIPPSLCMALTEPGWAGGGSPLHQEFARTGKCPRCGSPQSYIVVDALPGDTVTPDDVTLIKQYARHIARTGTTADLSCSECGARVPSAEGLKIGMAAYCEPCYESKYAAMLDTLRRKPNALEVSLVRKARAHARRASTPTS